MRLEVGALGELLVTAVEGTHVGPVPRVYPDVGAQVEVQGEALPASLEGALERLLARVHQLVALQLGALDEGLAALGAHVDARAVRVQVFAHGAVVAEHLGAALVRARDRPRNVVAGLALRLYSVVGTGTTRCKSSRNIHLWQVIPCKFC